MKVVFLALFLASFSILSFAQPDVVYQPLEWFSFSATVKVNKRMSVLEEGHFRYVGNFDPQQNQYRTGLDVSINKSLSIMPIGYVYTWNYLYGKQPATYENNEHRIFEQLVYKHSMGRAAVSHRLRLEQRFLQVHESQNGEVVNKGYDQYVNRLRYKLQANIPLSKTDGPKSWFMSFYDELFISYGSTVTYNEPDQNRVSAGLGYQVDKIFTIQAGPFYQLLMKQNGAQQENNIGLQLQVLCNLDLTKQ